ncbi:MAG: hypothetical protein JRH11_10610 [Deltaproteobacteria bacterium]|nr:hypothetical protein [Deltaproteobacteria bacterium]
MPGITSSFDDSRRGTACETTLTMALLSLIPLGLTGWIFWATVCRTGGPCS